MAFTTTVTSRTVIGNKRMVTGTWTTDTTGGDIDTGLSYVENIMLQTTGAAVSADQSSANETFPLGGGTAVTIVCTSGADGNWTAIGH